MHVVQPVKEPITTRLVPDRGRGAVVVCASAAAPIARCATHPRHLDEIITCYPKPPRPQPVHCHGRDRRDRRPSVSERRKSALSQSRPPTTASRSMVPVLPSRGALIRSEPGTLPRSPQIVRVTHRRARNPRYAGGKMSERRHRTRTRSAMADPAARLDSSFVAWHELGGDDHARSRQR